MLHRIAAVLLLLYLAAIGVNWPSLPFNTSIADFIFIPMAAAIVALPGTRLSWQRSDWAIVLYLAGALPAIAVSSDQQRSGIELVREIYLVAIYIVIAIAARQGFAHTIGMGFSICGALLSVAGLAFVAGHAIGVPIWPPMGEVMQLPYLGDTLRIRALTASEAMFACVLTAAVPFAIVFCRGGRMRTRCIAGALMLIAAGLTFSHAIAGFAVSVLIAFWPSMSKVPAIRRLATVAVVGIVLAFNLAATASIKSISYGAANYSDPSQYHYAIEAQRVQIGGATITYNVMSYARIKQVAWRAFVEHPIAGIGLDRFHTETERAFKEGRLTASYREIDPHSTVIGRFAECGVIGGTTLLLLWVAWARMAINGVRLRARGAAPDNIVFAAAAALAGLVVSSLNADIMNFRFLWVIAGLLRGLQEANGIAMASGRDETLTAGTD